ncbi:TetR/AcrR family transcriptional regulator [Actinomycetospora chibensis]|uniref:TetR/AcrR family transcriptional regulator n=1 Tax=Actinomycetospora chibensis TaxID=663606 RepID=A0ABV9RD26_9PSEU|nr:TetR/AcrR family transcriptional regulator [Actinomycetospora chibensis]MDD7925053.1 TetR/AcrR family transcriptional regulator [Actinomycetospora chibensis]
MVRSPAQDEAAQEDPAGAVSDEPAPRRRGRPPATDGPSTEEIILRTAREAFGELGYDRTTFREIAERAGLTRPAVNHYFPGKRALYDAVFASTQDRVVTAGILSATPDPDVSVRLSAFLHAAADVDSQDRSFARFITSSLLDAVRHPELADHAEGQLEALRTFTRSILEEGIAAGQVREDLDVPAVTEMLLAIMWGMGLYAGFVGTHEQLESVVDQFAMLLGGTLW